MKKETSLPVAESATSGKQSWTPTPWRTSNGCIVVRSDGRTIADCGTTRSIPGMDADAAFIVIAANNHAKLREALRDELGALEVWIRAAGIPDDVFDRLQISRDKIKAALKESEA